jgi:hypothetical protein
MSVESDFFKGYAKALENGAAALFVGAGLSMGAGFPDWRALLSGPAEEIDLDASRETDLPAVAQFYVNRFAASRGALGQLVRETFQRRVAIPENQRILARLPVPHVWTTNYDQLLERAWEIHGKRLDVKSRNADLTSSDPEADAILYKMHGTVEHPDDIVLTRDDYELYAKGRPGFFQILGSDLITHTFLFLGLSFTDPNLGYLMGALRASFQSAARQHYTILKRPAGDYEAKRFRLFTDDLHRYGIRTLVVDDHAGITRVLQQLERCYAQKNVFVSGSYPEEAGDADERGFVRQVAHDVGKLIGRRGLNLVSGFGRVVGPSAVAGLIDAGPSGEHHPLSSVALARRLAVRPIPNVTPEGISLDAFKRGYREDMIAQSGVMIVVGGLRRGVDSPGVLDEFEMAVAQKRIVLPIAATGHAARTVYDRLLERPAELLPAELDVETLRRLGPETRSVPEIVEALDACLTRITGRRVPGG